MDICIAEFLRMPLISSQHFPVWVSSQMSVWVRPHHLASARHVWFSVRMSAVVSISTNQSSNFKESCPSNVGISWSMIVVRLDFLCVVCRVYVYACMVLCTGSSLDFETGWRTIVRCSSLSVCCNSSSAGVDWGVLDFKLANWFLSCWNCSCRSAKGWHISVSSEYSSDESLSPSSTGVLWHKIQGGSVLGVKDVLCVLTSVSVCHAVCLVMCSKGI